MAVENADWGGHSGSRLGLDIGGTLAKLVFFESETRPSWCNGRLAEVVKSLGGTERPALQNTSDADVLEAGFSRRGSFWGEQDLELSFYDEKLKGQFHFLCFRSAQMERFVSLIAAQELQHDIEEIFTTGGGAYKYAKLFKDRLGITLQPVDELGVVIRGISWLVDKRMSEVYWYEEPCPSEGSSEPECYFLGEDEMKDLFPFILVNIGSGVSIVRVDGIDQFERISGSALGGGTFWGLCKLLCPGCKDFGEASCLAAEGDSSSINLTVEDIYGGDYELPSGAKLPGKLVASFFAKAGKPDHQDCAAVLNALITMVSQNICQIAFLNSRLQSVSRIVFTGNFLRQNQVARQVIAANMRRVSTASQGRQAVQALFLQHEGYFGALGSFLHNLEENGLSPVTACKRLPTRREGTGEASPSMARSRSFSEALQSMHRRMGNICSMQCSQLRLSIRELSMPRELSKV